MSYDGGRRFHDFMQYQLGPLQALDQQMRENAERAAYEASLGSPVSPTGSSRYVPVGGEIVYPDGSTGKVLGYYGAITGRRITEAELLGQTPMPPLATDERPSEQGEQVRVDDSAATTYTAFARALQGNDLTAAQAPAVGRARVPVSQWKDSQPAGPDGSYTRLPARTDPNQHMYGTGAPSAPMSTEAQKKMDGVERAGVVVGVGLLAVLMGTLIYNGNRQ